MGMPCGVSRCSDSSDIVLRNVRDESVSNEKEPEGSSQSRTGNPNPARFKLLRVERAKRFVVALVEYPDSLNYEGRKILVFENTTVAEVKSQKTLDPHFCDSGRHLSPVARFVPSGKGWKYAKSFCRTA